MVSKCLVYKTHYAYVLLLCGFVALTGRCFRAQKSSRIEGSGKNKDGFSYLFTNANFLVHHPESKGS